MLDNKSYGCMLEHTHLVLQVNKSALWLGRSIRMKLGEIVRKDGG